MASMIVVITIGSIARAAERGQAGSEHAKLKDCMTRLQHKASGTVTLRAGRPQCMPRGRLRSQAWFRGMWQPHHSSFFSALREVPEGEGRTPYNEYASKAM